MDYMGKVQSIPEDWWYDEEEEEESSDESSEEETKERTLSVIKEEGEDGSHQLVAEEPNLTHDESIEAKHDEAAGDEEISPLEDGLGYALEAISSIHRFIAASSNLKEREHLQVLMKHPLISLYLVSAEFY